MWHVNLFASLLSDPHFCVFHWSLLHLFPIATVAPPTIEVHTRPTTVRNISTLAALPEGSTTEMIQTQRMDTTTAERGIHAWESCDYHNTLNPSVSKHINILVQVCIHAVHTKVNSLMWMQMLIHIMTYACSHRHISTERIWVWDGHVPCKPHLIPGRGSCDILWSFCSKVFFCVFLHVMALQTFYPLEADSCCALRAFVYR